MTLYKCRVPRKPILWIVESHDHSSHLRSARFDGTHISLELHSHKNLCFAAPSRPARNAKIRKIRKISKRDQVLELILKSILRKRVSKFRRNLKISSSEVSEKLSFLSKRSEQRSKKNRISKEIQMKKLSFKIHFPKEIKICSKFILKLFGLKFVLKFVFVPSEVIQGSPMHRPILSFSGE